MSTANNNESNYLLGGGKDGKGRWSTIQCLLFAFVIAALVGFFSNLDRIIDGLSDDDDNNEPLTEEKITEIVSNREDLSTLSSALTTADLTSALEGDGPFTLFAPTNNAFDAITIPTNITTLSNILLYHVVGASVLSTDLSSGLVADTLNGETVTALVDDGVFFYDSNGRLSQVIEADIIGSNGVIHIIDTVLLPQGTLNDIVQNVPSLSSLNTALIDNGLDAALSDPSATYTLFAPTNDAIEMFSGSIGDQDLLFHLLPDIYMSDDIPANPTQITTASGDILSVVKLDDDVFVTDAVGRIGAVTIANIKGTNGVVHIIDIVLARTEFRSIVDLAVGRDDLSTLVSALTTADLVDTLSGPGPFTVLAPTDTAFGAIDVPSNVTVLTSVLLYHVLGASVLSSDLSSGLIATTLNGETVTALVTDGVFFYDSNGRLSQVQEADIIGTNGVIHVVDTVLLPGGTLNDIVQNVPSLSVLNGALIANGLNETLADPAGTFTLFAPTNDAVSAFTGDVTADVLTYHVLATEYRSGDIPDGLTTLATVNGATLNVTKNGTGVFVEDQEGRVGTVTTANIVGVNGVAHIIDIVLSPTAA